MPSSFFRRVCLERYWNSHGAQWICCDDSLHSDGHLWISRNVESHEICRCRFWLGNVGLEGCTVSCCLWNTREELTSSDQMKSQAAEKNDDLLRVSIIYPIFKFGKSTRNWPCSSSQTVELPEGISINIPVLSHHYPIIQVSFQKSSRFHQLSISIRRFPGDLRSSDFRHGEPWSDLRTPTGGKIPEGWEGSGKSSK